MNQTSNEPVAAPENEEKTWWNKKNTIILSSIIVFIVILALIAASGTDLGTVFSDWTLAYYAMFGVLGVYLIIFVISSFANMTVLFPVPYAVALAFIAIKIHEGTMVGINIWILGIIAGIGAAIGEITAYYLGRGSAALLNSKEEGKSVQKMKDRINRGWAVPLMFLCAATFIPDDPLLLLLGYAGYPLWKMLITYFAGKIVLCISTIYIVILAYDIPALYNFFWILGVTESGAPLNPWISFLGWVGVLLLFFLIFYVDWTSKFKSIYRKLFKKEEVTNETNLIRFRGEHNYYLFKRV